MSACKLLSKQFFSQFKIQKHTLPPRNAHAGLRATYRHEPHRHCVVGMPLIGFFFVYIFNLNNRRHQLLLQIRQKYDQSATVTSHPH